jgi:RNA polymerase sigma-70 factor (ECF subfamily)
VTRNAQRTPTPQEATTHGAEPSRQFTELYEQNFDFVWRSARMLGVPPEAADDAVQDVFLVAHRRMHDFEGRAGARTWLFAIALRVVSDYRRSRARRMRLLDRAITVEPIPAQTPFDTTARTEQSQVLLAALETLPDEQRAVFILAEIEEMTAPEIASSLEMKLNTVYSRLRGARLAMAERLRGLMQGDGA